ncbi:MAG: GNAT family N-acetyltransferase [Acidobacteria bacterium]|nr:GNAT family N-acetyltransferase [Acidobacteriota bacterium]
MQWKLIDISHIEEEREGWHEFLASADRPTQYSSEHFFTDPFVHGGERFVIAAKDADGKVAALMSGVRSGRTVTCGLPSRPQLFFRKNADRFEATRCLVEGLTNTFDQKLTQIVAWQKIEALESLGFKRADDTGSNEVVLLDLSFGYEHLFKNFSSARRNGIRKAERYGVEISRLESDADIAALYEIHVQWNRRKGNRPDELDAFRLGAQQTDSRAIFIAKYEGEVIAGSYFRFLKGGVVEYAGNNSFPEHQHLKPNELLLSHAIKWSCEHRFRSFSLGGAHPFLRRFGGEVVQTSVYTSDRTFLKLNQRFESLQRLRSRLIHLIGQKNKERIARLVGRTA